MQRDAAFLLDILDSARLIQEYVRDREPVEFLSETGLQDKVIRRFEVMGEAARRVSEETKKKHPEIPWREMSGLRNILIHEYGEINLELLWTMITDDLPPLIRNLEPLVPPPSPDSMV